MTIAVVQPSGTRPTDMKEVNMADMDSDRQGLEFRKDMTLFFLRDVVDVDVVGNGTKFSWGAPIVRDK